MGVGIVPVVQAQAFPLVVLGPQVGIARIQVEEEGPEIVDRDQSDVSRVAFHVREDRGSIDVARHDQLAHLVGADVRITKVTGDSRVIVDPFVSKPLAIEIIGGVVDGLVEHEVEGEATGIVVVDRRGSWPHLDGVIGCYDIQAFVDQGGIGPSAGSLPESCPGGQAEVVGAQVEVGGNIEIGPEGFRLGEPERIVDVKASSIHVVAEIPDIVDRRGRVGPVLHRRPAQARTASVEEGGLGGLVEVELIGVEIEPDAVASGRVDNQLLVSQAFEAGVEGHVGESGVECLGGRRGVGSCVPVLRDGDEGVEDVVDTAWSHDGAAAVREASTVPKADRIPGDRVVDDLWGVNYLRTRVESDGDSHGIVDDETVADGWPQGAFGAGADYDAA